MTAALATSLPLPVLDTSIQRPVYARGPRSLASVKLLRLSVTDRCNLRCIYCMPSGGLEFHEKDDLLGPADFEAVARVAVRAGVTHLKLTGGEPTIRRDIVEIASRLASLEPEDLSLTTNGLQLHRLAKPLREAGVDRLTLSLDTLKPDRYERVTGGGRLELFWRGVEAALEAGFRRIKINVVVIRGVNDDEVTDLAALTLERDWTVRFIEYMPLGDSQVIAEHFDPLEATLDNEIVKARIAARFGELVPVDRASEAGVGPAKVFALPGPGVARHVRVDIPGDVRGYVRGRLGFISAMSRPFCETCNRLRLTAMGELRSCLFDGGEVSVLPALRPAVDEARLEEMLAECVQLKPEVHSNRGNRAMSQIGG